MGGLPHWSTLSLPHQVAQLIVVRASGYLFDHQIQYPEWEPPAAVLQHWLSDLGMGGVILLGGSAVEVALRTRQLQDWAAVPLLIAADIEEGVGQRFSGATGFPPPMALGAIAQRDLRAATTYAEAMGAITAEEARAIGINWLLAPVVDVNNNPENPVINVRAWGETPEQVSQLTTAFLRGAKQVLTTAKHFPGHGDTATDSHLDLPVIPHDKARLMQIELPPFQQAIAAGVDAVMTAHLHLPALDPVYPATLSPALLTGELRQRLGFKGLIVTDALVMGAITHRYGANEAPVLALEAGADIVLMPVDPVGAIEAICAAVESGRIPVERIHASLERLWRAKQRACSPFIFGDPPHAGQQTPPPMAIEALARPQALTTATAMLRDSMQVYHPESSRLHSRESIGKHNLILVDDALSCNFLGRQAPAIALPQEWGYSLQVIDSYTPIRIQEQSTQPPAATLLQLFIRGNPFRSSANLLTLAQQWLVYLRQTNQLQAVAIYGSPYVLAQLRPQMPPDVPYVFTYGQMPAAQAIALQALFATAPAQQTSRPREFTD
ncbi:MAG: beta-glucosidase [Synechococcales cyanobacterium M58_A2018_015]|nr:beta-glucosidase [Synechococcales cyanobacterium M58_A2018_015]